MRLTVLPPPTPPVRALPRHGAGEAVIRAPSRGDGPRRAEPSSPVLGALHEPTPARSRARRFFDPASGRIRRFERWISHQLSRRILPLVPGVTWPYGRQLRSDLTLATADLAVPRLAESFEGLKVLLVTDPHAGPFVSPRDLEDAFERLMTVKPDLVLLGGDFATTSVADFEQAASAFRRFRAPLGVFAVLGNHDHYTRDAAGVKRRIEGEGIEVLENRSVAVRRNGASFLLAGIDDLMAGRPDLDAALDGWSGEEACVLLSHNPDVFFEAARRDVGLVLAGHTHGGQIRMPGLPVLVRQSRFRLDEGRYRAGRSELVVSRGIGVVGLPWRIGCPPEAVFLTLRAARSPSRGRLLSRFD